MRYRLRMSLAVLLATTGILSGCGGGHQAEKTGRVNLGANYAPLTNNRQNTTKPSLGAQATFTPAWLGEWPLTSPGEAQNYWAAVSDKQHCSVTTSASNFPDSEIREVANGQQVTASTGSVLTTPSFARGQATYFDMPARNNVCYGGRTEETTLNPWSSSKADHRFYAGHKFTEAWQFAVTPTFLASIKYGSHNGSEITQIHVSGSGKSPWGASIQPGGPKEESSTEGQLRINFFGKSESYVGINTGMAIKPNVVYNIVNEYDGESNTTGSWKVYAGPASAGPNPPLVAQESGLRTIREGEPDGATWGWYPGYYTGELGAFTGWESGFNVELLAAEAKAIAFGSEQPPVKTETTETTPPPPPPTVPAAPTNIVATVVSGPKVQITGSTVSGATKYYLYRAGKDYPGHAEGTPWGEALTPSFTNAAELPAGARECYWLSAANAVGESPKPTLAQACVHLP